MVQNEQRVSRAQLASQLAALDLAESAAESSIRDRMLDLLGREPRCFDRSTFPAHFTGSALLVSAEGAETLLHHHRKLDRWLQFGGHCDGEEDVQAVARREALEESGIIGLKAVSPLPFDLDIHLIPARGEEPEHWHYDIRYLFLAPTEAAFRGSEESRELRWFTATEMERLPLDTGLRRLLAKWRRWMKEGT